MGVESAEDRAMFLSAADFGTVARYIPDYGSPVSITGIFDNAHLMVEAGNAGVSGTAPVFTCRADDIAALPMGRVMPGDKITVDGIDYAINDAQPDGTGMTVLILEQRG